MIRLLKVMQYRKRKTDGFTLVELLIVVVIVIILAAVLFPRFLSYSENARKAKAMADLRVMQSVVESFCADEGNGFYPVESNEKSNTKSIAAVLQKKWNYVDR